MINREMKKHMIEDYHKGYTRMKELQYLEQIIEQFHESDINELDEWDIEQLENLVLKVKDILNV